MTDTPPQDRLAALPQPRPRRGIAEARGRIETGLMGARLSVLMRYTLRLLTLDQLARAAGLVCAMELERKERGRLREWPIEIGLWVGGGATPNRFGSRTDKKKGTLVDWMAMMRGGGPPPFRSPHVPGAVTRSGRINFT